MRSWQKGKSQTVRVISSEKGEKVEKVEKSRAARQGPDVSQSGTDGRLPARAPEGPRAAPRYRSNAQSRETAPAPSSK